MDSFLGISPLPVTSKFCHFLSAFIFILLCPGNRPGMLHFAVRTSFPGLSTPDFCDIAASGCPTSLSHLSEFPIYLSACCLVRLFFILTFRYLYSNGFGIQLTSVCLFVCLLVFLTLPVFINSDFTLQPPGEILQNWIS